MLCFTTFSFAGIGQGKSINDSQQLKSSPRALGVRLGIANEISYQHSLKNGFFEMNLGMLGINPNINATVVYNFMKPLNWSSRGQWGVYWGCGLAFGYGKGYDFNYFDAGIVTQAGLEYTFSFPLQIAIDVRPHIGLRVLPNYGASFCVNLDYYMPALSIRYRF